MQRFISVAEWDEDKISRKYRTLVNDDMGDPNGILIFDESGFVKKGSDSIGVARQYCGTIGKVDNCQVGVFAAYASPQGYALIDKRLFIPEKWFAKDYAAKREKCALPENIKFKTKPQLAVEMFTAIRDEGILPFKYIATDSLYGSSPEFINAIPMEFVITVSVELAWYRRFSGSEGSDRGMWSELRRASRRTLLRGSLLC
jgi:SRSO17 transposase